MSGRVVSDIQTRAEGESLYIRYNTDANVVNNLKNDSSYKFIGEVILKINVVLGLFIWEEVIPVSEKTFRQVYERDLAFLRK